MPVEHDPPVDVLDDDFPIRLTTGRRLESFNTGVQTGGYSSPLHRDGTAIRLAPEDGARYGVADGGRVRVVSRRGAVEAPVLYDDTLRPETFRKLARRDRLPDVLDGLAAAAEAGLTPVKVNAVLMREFGFHGPSMNLSAACSSANVGLITAQLWLAQGLADDVPVWKPAMV